VSPTIASEPGRVRLTFTRQPIMPPPATHNKFDDAVIASAQYEEANGVAVLTVATSAPLLASFSNEGRTLTLSRAPQTRAGKTCGARHCTNSGGAPLASGTVEVPRGLFRTELRRPLLPAFDNGLRHFFAVIDAGHGGERLSGIQQRIAGERRVPELCPALAEGVAEPRHFRLDPPGRRCHVDAGATRIARELSAPAIYIALHAASQDGVFAF